MASAAEKGFSGVVHVQVGTPAPPPAGPKPATTAADSGVAFRDWVVADRTFKENAIKIPRFS